MLRYLILSLAVACVTAGTEVYKGYELLSVTPRSLAEGEFLVKLLENEGEIDVWQPSSGVNHPAIIMVPPNILQKVKTQLNQQNLEWSVLNTDLDALAQESYKDVANDSESESEVLGQATSDTVPHNRYYTLSQIETYMLRFRQNYPNNVVLGTLGSTYNGNRLRYIKISTKATTANNQKQSIMIEGGIHAREWISPASLLYFIDKMLQDYTNKQNPGYNMIRQYDWYIVLVANPDGYRYTHESGERYWRKNRNPNTGCSGNSGVGVDPNRNFGYYFRRRNCGDTFAGNSAFSEYESRALRDFYHRERTSLKAYVTIHSFAQTILVPWFWSTGSTRPDNYDELQRAARKMYYKMYEANQYYFRIVSVAQAFGYVATGSSADWALQQKPGLISLSIELRPDNRRIRDASGFAPPTSDIPRSGKEVYAAFEGLYDYFNPGLDR